ncbi:hypothetical protein A3I50_02095 [Candidatus Roizmanbacteria bacterium RIFCSPLOWO2_02_FULL_37_9]|uniref:Uncharacterized protein n=1 Tax=Candidatus Roizmanbacteria bacterium RIFCSPLOWO2_01_FULL_37_16 TaxID=1802058 RepID=A0A1F7IKC6_9BACT|nr:MAG: hypothetical protein A2859_05670 [Candidatus Roizmanbacteria bacterium RIFCSPHIGHO2_01_FULL_37_16b]OGK33966.1 MAG: hypothetical protein A3F57_06110 [Candidatus Roizmanbacteria bacterium RIFCSPHIGHO2_12_FULL_36_11]OGK43827.1 MAG: hypothetical protein A3B40_01120 [Candidatus Roizmanbacteria bacterium RIFCSPLOWO2_01_FULL_37_16]OGK57095.1 MAG: hypothetical protein A3I50_02095 [Candidatus Roizmanbacteria bacterium RIFCSPLOWO2_02_FULL_37_9]
MDDLFQKYQEKISSLALSSKAKQEIFQNFYFELQFQLINSFFDTLTDNQKKEIAEASSDEEAIRLYFRFLNESVEIPEFLQFIEQIYSEAMTKALDSLPEFSQPSA